MTGLDGAGIAPGAAGGLSAAAAPGANMAADASAFTAQLDSLEAAAPSAGPSSLNDWMGQAQSSLTAAFDPDVITKLPPNASVLETYQHLAKVHTQVSGGQQLMSMLQMLSNKVHKVAESLLPKTG